MTDRIYTGVQKTDDAGRVVLITQETHNDLKASSGGPRSWWP